MTELKKQKEKKEKTKMDGVILYGPPGNGKTNFVLKLGVEAGVPVVMLNTNNLITDPKYFLANFK